MNLRISITLSTVVVGALLSSCGTSDKSSDTSTEAKSSPAAAAAPVFSVDQAQDNLTFAKNQYLVMIDNVAKQQHLTYGSAKQEQQCLTPAVQCLPRAEVHEGIHMESPRRWTNGFYPGVLWKLLVAQSQTAAYPESEQATLVAAAKQAQVSLYEDSQRSNTHDLGFLLYDSFGEALSYDGLDETTRASYQQALDAGRVGLASRFNADKGVIRSWSWEPQFSIITKTEDGQQFGRYRLAKPWQYPVIVDNMMNLEFLLSSENTEHQLIAYRHGEQTLNNHYFYEPTDTEQQRPIAYHVFDYDSNKPGNWQGLGNRSAWARGQGWSLYGFITILEALQNGVAAPADYPNIEQHIQRLIGTLSHYMTDEPVPYWDWFAPRDNAYEYAEYIGEDTTIYSGILGVCDHRIEPEILPYKGYRPIAVPQTLVSEESLAALADKQSLSGEPILAEGKVRPCGTKAYADSHVKIPRDTSAAGLIASALYQYAMITKAGNSADQAVALADHIMAALSAYRTDANTSYSHSRKLGFVLAEATGNMNSASEIDTPIVYGDFYFVEANMRKLAYEQAKAQ